MTDLYLKILEYPNEKIAGKIFNCGYQNNKVKDIALTVKQVLGRKNLVIDYKDSDDKRSYSISSERIKRELGFIPQHTIEEAVKDLKKAFEEGRILNPMENIKYYNIKMMQAIQLT